MTQEQEPTSQIIIPSGFGSSSRQRERIAQSERESRSKIELPGSWRKDLAEEVSSEEDSGFKEFRGSQKPVILDEVLSATEVELPITEEADDSPIEIENEPVIIESDPKTKIRERKFSFLQTTRAAGKGIKAGLTSRQAKRIARTTKDASARAARTSAKVGATTRGVVFVAGKRIEERTLDRPRNQKALFRPLESRERRLLGLPTNEPISREELKFIALGVTPPTVIRARIAQTKELDSIIREYKDKLEQLPYGADIKDRVSALANEEDRLRKSNADPQLIANIYNERKIAREAAAKYEEYKQIIEGLEGRKKSILSSTKTDIDPAIRQRAFGQALRISPSVAPVGSLKTKTKIKGRGPGRPPKNKKPEIKLNV